mmetsp:Transcript_80832/g.127716  ORF Transcript_80832/g.127716 Transcript_80832/m.127716 type:complete len:163 (-) Transcript_80832:45-533(-)
MAQTGTLKKFFAEKGIGYITPDDGTEDVFIHFQAVINGGEADMIPGAKLSYDLEINDRNGKTKAVRVKIESPGDPSSQLKGGGAAGGKGYGKATGGKRGHGAGPYGQPNSAYGIANLAAGYDMSAAYWASLYQQATQGTGGGDTWAQGGTEQSWGGYGKGSY